MVIFALGMAILLGFGALAIDVSYAHLVTTQAQTAADVGAHATLVQVTREEDWSLAREVSSLVVQENMLAGEPAAVDTSSDMVIGGWDFESSRFDPSESYTNAIRVDVRKSSDSVNGSLHLPIIDAFGRLQGAGPYQGDIQPAGVATAAFRPRDLMIVVDVTLSFSEEIDGIREALVDFLDYLALQHGYPLDRVGMVVFTSEASVYTELSFLVDDYDAIRSDWELLYLCSAEWMDVDCTADPVGRGAGTDQAAALDLAIEQLTDGRDDNPLAQQLVLLVSDGVPYCQGSCDWAGCYGAIRTEALSYADYADTSQNISLHSVFFADPDGTSTDSSDACSDYTDAIDEQAAFMRSLRRGDGRYYGTSDSEELGDLFTAIGREMQVVLVD
ncbi:MAG: VWA domain-containing protein [Myxococcota bacterium]|nr:VWA domain-containing protein [Myxococcota bacterium]